MTPGPLRPARIEWADDGTPYAPDFSDRYHPHAGAVVQARHVFLGGNGLPRRWQGQDDFTIVETGFGLGHNFLATWQAWRDDPQRCARLHHVAVEAHPPALHDLQRAHATARPAHAPELTAALQASWPPLVPGLHLLTFDGGAVRLLLALGDVHDVLPQLQLRADAFFLDGFAPDRNPQMWDRAVLKALAWRAAPGATAATWSVAHGLRNGLAAEGFHCTLHPGVGGKREVLHAAYAPRYQRPHEPPAADPAWPRADAASWLACCSVRRVFSILMRSFLPRAPDLRLKPTVIRSWVSISWNSLRILMPWPAGTWSMTEP